MGPRSTFVLRPPSCMFGKLLNLAVSDVLGKESEVSVYIYDAGNQEVFLGHAKVDPDVFRGTNRVEGWYKLEARDPEEDQVSGEVHLEISFQKTDKKHYGPEDFRILKLIGKGSLLCSDHMSFPRCC